MKRYFTILWCALWGKAVTAAEVQTLQQSVNKINEGYNDAVKKIENLQKLYCSAVDEYSLYKEKCEKLEQQSRSYTSLIENLRKRIHEYQERINEYNKALN